MRSDPILSQSNQVFAFLKSEKKPDRSEKNLIDPKLPKAKIGSDRCVKWPNNVAYGYAIKDTVDEIRLNEFLSQTGWAFKNNSELLELFNFQFLKMRRSGILKKIHEKWFDWLIPDAERYVKNPIDEMFEGVDSIGFENLLFPFMVTGFGLLSALILVLFEKITSLFLSHQT